MAAPPLIGRRRKLPALAGHGGASWHRWRTPFSRRTPLLIETVRNPFTLATERRIADKGPLAWLAALIVIAIAPPLLGDNSALAAASVFAMYAAINIVWMLTIGTAGIFSLATFAVVGAGAYGSSYLSLQFGLPWWGMILVSPVFGLILG